MKIHFFGAARCVSGSCYLLETKNHKIMIDCGMFQGPKLLKQRNYDKFPFDVRSIDVVLLTHAHIDHSGLIPKLYKDGYRNAIYSTEATVDLCSIMLPDSGHIQEMEVDRKNRKARRSGKKLLQPIYSYDDAVKSISLFEKCKYDHPIAIFDNVIVTFRDAGHIMGSAVIEVELLEDNEKTKIVFSGDLGRKGQNIINDPNSILEADYLLLETTYGDRLHHETENRKQKLAEIVTKTLKKGGNVIIPAFAVERTQDLLYDLNSLVTEGVIKQGTIYIDSPLAIRATEVFSKHPETFDEETQNFYKDKGFLPFLPKNLKYSNTAEESKQLNEIKGGNIVISANGMAEAGRIRHHLRHNLWRPESSVIFIGYQAESSLGRRLVDGEKQVRIFGEEINVNAEIHFIEAYSGHADYQEIIDWLQHFTKAPKKVFLVHGEKPAAEYMALQIKNVFGWETVIPNLMDQYDIEKQELIKSPVIYDFEAIKAREEKNSVKDIQISLERIGNILDKAVNKKFNLNQYRTVKDELSNIKKLLNKVKLDK